MSRKTYAIGDRVVIKAGLLRQASGERTCRIVGVLPADHGEVQYRVRLEGENFERRIVQSDIDADETAAPSSRKTVAASVPGNGSPWLKPLTTRNGK
ncbi:cold-shock protein [Shinella sp. CPCC 101442]|uniref:cold-shock protein n=1 Tax=Shinella sp. CPCC 101442 TaxID=2932265 RepID=UPI0021526467|nr:cold-shock protein [Shinella sp. CPCC 101442]MCR6500878.1 cold-shock protein [Shinella sp. CPCC 101442]